MSQILDQLKRAEAEREHLIAERRRIETEADAALAARERAESGPQRPVLREPAPAPKRRLLAGLVAFAFIAAMSVALLFPGEKQSAQKEMPARTPVIAVPAAHFELKLDRDLESFARRLQEKEKP